MKRIAIVVSHPIQHFCPQYASIAAIGEIELRVFFGSTVGYKNYFDKHFGKEISWANLYLDKFDHVFLNGGEMAPVDKTLDAPDLQDRLEEFDPQLVVVYGFFQKLSRNAVAWAVKNKRKVAYIADSELNNGRRNGWTGRLKRFYLSNFFRKIDFFLSVGHSNRLYYQKHGVPQDRIRHMHFPIDIELYKESWKTRESGRERVRRQFGFSPEDIVVSMVGKLVNWKSQVHLAEAALLLEKKGYRLNVLIIGSGEDEAEINRKSADLRDSRVIITGFVTPEELPAYYAASDIYIHASKFEPHSLAISEAIYMGLPVIVSDHCGSYGEDDDVQENRNGYVYPWSDIDGLAACILKFMTDRSLSSRFGQVSHQLSATFQEMSHRTCWTQLIKEI